MTNCFADEFLQSAKSNRRLFFPTTFFADEFLKEEIFTNKEHFDIVHCDSEACSILSDTEPVTEWTPWSDCDRPCGTGNTKRTRECQGDMDDCKAYSMIDEDVCNTEHCPGTELYCLKKVLPPNLEIYFIGQISLFML